jgi:hypothetical protein
MTSSANIRRLFLDPRRDYSVAEAALLLALDRRDVRSWIESGELEAVETEQGLMVPWSELVSFGMDFWSPEAIGEALGDDLDVIPELLRLTDLAVRIPRLQVVALERLAGSRGEDGGYGPGPGASGPGVGALPVAGARDGRVRGGLRLARAGVGRERSERPPPANAGAIEA